MWVVEQGARAHEPGLGLGRLGCIGVIFCITLLISTITGGNMFQAWNVGEITDSVLRRAERRDAASCWRCWSGMVIIGGIKRIGAVAGRLVPFMVALYLLGGGLRAGRQHRARSRRCSALIFRRPSRPTEASGALLGGTMGYAFLFGMKRALFSNEAGQGSSPIAHSAAKTDEPVREGIVAGLEPFIDTLVVCTLTALVILVHRRLEPAGRTPPTPRCPRCTRREPGRRGRWQTARRADARDGASGPTARRSFVIVSAHANPQTAIDLHRLDGRHRAPRTAGRMIEWGTIASPVPDAGGHRASTRPTSARR